MAAELGDENFVVIALASDRNWTDVLLAIVPMFHANCWGLPFGAAMLGSGIVLPGHDEDVARLNEIAEAYKARFKQHSVITIVRPACVSF